MKPFFQLEMILDRVGFDTYGRINKIADATRINRHTVRKILRNEASNVSLDTIGRICDWLREKEYCDDLPGALFAAQPDELLQAMAGPVIKLIIGERINVPDPESETERSPRFARAWVSRDDFSVAARIVECFSRLGRRDEGRRSASRESGNGERRDWIRFDYVNVPVHVPSASCTPGDVHRLQAADQKTATALFKEVRADRCGATNVYIGSQRVNALAELFVADLFRCRPFAPADKAVPFYLKWNEEYAPSCFGGVDAPRPGGAGVYYLRGGAWRHFPSEPGRSGAGLIVVRREEGRHRIEVAVFGVAGMATAALGNVVCEKPDLLSAPLVRRGGLEVGVFAVGFSLRGVEAGAEAIEDVKIADLDVAGVDLDLPRRHRPSPASTRMAAPTGQAKESSC